MIVRKLGFTAGSQKCGDGTQRRVSPCMRARQLIAQLEREMLV